MTEDDLEFASESPEMTGLSASCLFHFFFPPFKERKLEILQLFFPVALCLGTKTASKEKNAGRLKWITAPESEAELTDK